MRALPALAVAVVTALLVVACGSDSDSADAGSGEFTVEDLIGVWETDEPSFVQFNEDGTYRIAFSEETLQESPVERGAFTLEGTSFTLISDEASESCAEGDRGRYENEVLGDDRIRQVLVEDECSIRASTGDVTIERVPSG